MSNELTTTQQNIVATANNGNPNATAMVAMSREQSEAISSLQIAKMFPRNIIAVRDNILNACSRQTLAEKAVYIYSRGGSEVSGPSIRLAEAVAQVYGNIDFGVRELEQKNGYSICEAYAWDKESNTRIAKTFHVSHIRHTKAGDKLLTDPRDIYELVANSGARRLRACILGVIPGDITEEAVEACKETLKRSVTITKERLSSMLEKFEDFGISKEQIEKKIQCRMDAIRPTQFLKLGEIYNSLKDGMSKPEDWFEVKQEKDEPVAKQTSGDKLRDAIGVKSKDKKDEKAEEPVDDMPY